MFAEVVAEGVYYIDNVVAGLLEVADNIHVVYAGLILVVARVDVLDVGAAERVSEVVDFTLFVV